MPSVHSAEWAIRARIVSGQNSGYSAIICAAILEASAVAALVALVVVNSRSVGRLLVVNRLRLGIGTALSESFAELPPSSTTSGFSGK